MGFFNQIKTHPVRFVKSCGLFSCFLTIGLSLGIVGPSLLDFSDKTHMDLKFVALILPFRAGGYAVGSFISGLMYHKVDFQLLTSITMAMAGAFTIAIPFITGIWALLVHFMIVGFCLGLFSAGGNIWVLDLWGKENPPFMQAVHFMYGFGAFVAPLIVRPFLQTQGSIDEEDSGCGSVPEEVTTQHTTNSSNSDATDIHEILESQVNLVAPFAIIGGLLLSNAIFFLAMRILYPKLKPHPSRLAPAPTVTTINSMSSPNDDQFDRESIASERARLPFTGVAAYTGSFSLGGSFSMSAGQSDKPPNLDSVSQVSGKGSLALRRKQLKELRYLSRQLSIASSTTGIPHRVGSLRSHVGSIRSSAPNQVAANESPQQNGSVNNLDECQPECQKRTFASTMNQFVTWCSSLDPWKVIVVVMSVAFMHIYYGLEITFGTFLTTFAHKSPLQLETTEGATITSIFWATFTFWRLPTIFYVDWIGPVKTILFNLIILVIGNIILVPWGATHTWALYSGAALVGLGASPIWASMFGLLELFFPVTSGIASAMITAAMIGEFIFPTIISGFVVCTPMVFSWVCLFCSLSVIGLFAAITLICLYKLTEPTLEEIRAEF